MPKKYKTNDRVALAEDITCRGKITSGTDPYSPQDTLLYTVQWDKSVSALYLPEALMPEKEAIEQQTKLDASKDPETKGVVQSVVAKFKAMVNK
jgi:hypothetical protein